MYEQHFNFTAPPFSIAPNPRYVYLSPQYREALAHLLYGISIGGGFVVLTGEVGTGKTTLCRCLMEQLPEDVDIALIFNPRLNARELLASICDELKISNPGEKTSIRRLIDLLNHHLMDTHARGRRTIVLIDEAQNLSYDVLEQIRLLTNLETNVSKLLQIILVGQPELNTLLARPNLRQLSQRITARYHLLPLSLAETGAYISRRLAVSGVTRKIFSRLAVGKIHRLSGGIPRLLNLICDRSLLGAYTLGKLEVGSGIVRKAAKEILPPSRNQPARMAFGLIAAIALMSLATGLYFDREAFRPHLMGFLDAMPLKFADKQPDKKEVNTKRADESPSGDGSPPQGIKATSAAATDFMTLISATDLTREAAFARLFSVWGSNGPEGANDECLFAKQNNLRCLSSNGGISLLSKLDHPAILEFMLPDGSNRYATVIGLQGQKCWLGMGKSNHSLDLTEMLPYWRGNFTLLWKPPGDTSGILKLGKSNEAVRWIRLQLNEPAAPGKETLFDDRLQHAIMGFQRNNSLLPDGEVGPMTMIQLLKASPDYMWPSLAKTKD